MFSARLIGRLRLFNANVFLSQITGGKQGNVDGWTEGNLFSFLNGSTVDYNDLKKQFQPINELQMRTMSQGIIMSHRTCHARLESKPLWLING